MTSEDLSPEIGGHLSGTQLAMAAELGLGSVTSSSTDHIESTRAAISAGASSAPAAAAAEFGRVSAILTDHLLQLDDPGLAAQSRFGTIEAVWPASRDGVAEIAPDAVAFCKRVASRVSLDDLDVDVSGDIAAANTVLDELATLALD